MTGVQTCALPICPDARQERGETVPQRDAEHAAKVAAKRPENAGLHHVQSPQEKCDTAYKIEEYGLSHFRIWPCPSGRQRIRFCSWLLIQSAAQMSRIIMRMDAAVS